MLLHAAKAELIDVLREKYKDKVAIPAMSEIVSFVFTLAPAPWLNAGQ